MPPHLHADAELHGDADVARRAFSRRALLILWPAFVMAGVLEMLVFAVVDPSVLHWFASAVEGSRSAVYSVSFFIFWGVIATSAAITAMLEGRADRAGGVSTPPVRMHN
jgi:hypothetical protein